MNKKTYFLDCLNVHLARIAVLPSRIQNSTIAVFQAEAYMIPEHAIPENPANAALEFYECAMGMRASAPPWLTEWEETKEKSDR